MPKPPVAVERKSVPEVEVEHPERFGPRVRQIREERGLSLRQVAAEAGIPPSVLSKFERGQVSPTLITARKILAALGLSFAEFFGTYRERPLEHPTIVFPAEGFRTLSSQGELLRWLLPVGPDFACQMFYEEIDPGVNRRDWETHSRDLVGYILSGEMVFRFPAENGKSPREVKVRTGETYYIPAGLAHKVANRGRKKCKLIDLILGRGKPLY
jgi:transcriptional regulator with XRE-family HTH domain